MKNQGFIFWLEGVVWYAQESEKLQEHVRIVF